MKNELIKPKGEGHWCIPADSVSIRPTKEVYPVNLFFNDHKFIEQMEIPNEDYIRIKIAGKWVAIYLPEEKYLDRI